MAQENNMGAGGRLEGRQGRKREPLKEQQAVGCSGSRAGLTKVAESERGKEVCRGGLQLATKTMLLTRSLATCSQGSYLSTVDLGNREPLTTKRMKVIARRTA